MVDPLREEYDAHVSWRPYLLRPDMPAGGLDIDPEYQSYRLGMRDRLLQRADAAGLPMTFMDEWLPNTHLALEASEYAREEGKHPGFHRIVFRKFYGEGKNIQDWKVLRSTAEEAHLDPDEMQQRTEAGEYREIVLASYREALARGVTGIPTYILNDRWAIVGAQPLQVFERAIREHKLAEDTHHHDGSRTRRSRGGE